MGFWDFVNNTWFVSIIGGLIVTAASGLATRIFLNRREAKDYQRAVDLANAEIVRSVRPSISEKALPPRNVIKSVIAATGRKYGVDPKDVYGIAEVVDELVNEVMASSFISAQTKVDYCASLSTLKVVPESEIPKPPASKPSKPWIRVTREDEVLTATISVLVATMSGLIFVFMAVELSDGLLAIARSFTVSLALPLAATVALMFFTPVILRGMRHSQEKATGNAGQGKPGAEQTSKKDEPGNSPEKGPPVEVK